MEKYNVKHKSETFFLLCTSFYLQVKQILGSYKKMKKMVRCEVHYKLRSNWFIVQVQVTKNDSVTKELSPNLVDFSLFDWLEFTASRSRLVQSKMTHYDVLFFIKRKNNKSTSTWNAYRSVSFVISKQSKDWISSPLLCRGGYGMSTFLSRIM